MDNSSTMEKKMGSFVGELFARLAQKAGVTIHLEPGYGYAGQIITRSGKKHYFRSGRLDINTLGSTEIAADKDYASYFMQQMGYPTPRGKSFYSKGWNATLGEDRGVDAGWSYAQSLGLPVIVKPNSKSQGQGVFKANTKREFYRAFRAASRKDNVVLVQEVLSGKDYRIVVLDDEVISAYERLPLQVTGDGRKTIAELIELKQEGFVTTGRDTVLKLDDWRIGARLARKHRSLATILAKGENLVLLDNANLSSGGDGIDITDDLHPSFRNASIAVTKDMGLRLCGVDIMVDGDAREEAPYHIIEINAAPGLDNYFSQGPEQQKRVEDLYLKLLISMND